MTQDANNKVTLTIDGQRVTVERGTMLIEAAKQAGIEIPHYCYDRDLSIVASCRLCLVEVEKVPKLVPSCSTPANEGQVVFTQSERVLDARQMQMEFLLVQHPLDCPVCDQGGECKLQDYSMNHGTDDTRFRFVRRTFPKPDIGPFIDLERNRCILCSRCVRFMDEIAGNAELAIVQRGYRSHIATFQDQPLQNEFAGNTIDLCPVGALTSKVTRFRTRVWEVEDANAIASMASCGSNVYMQYRNRTHEILRILPRDNPKVNHRWISDIERFSFDRFNTEQRQTQVKTRDDNGQWHPISWAKGIRQVVDSLKKIKQEQGSQAIAGITAPWLSNETLFLFQQFLREILETQNIDHRTEHVIHNNDDGYLTSLARNAANQPFQEIQKASAIFVLGSDLPNENPILHLQVRIPASQKKKKAYCAHHRPTRLDKECQSAFHYKPGSETQFLAALLCAVAKEAGKALPVEGLKLEPLAKECGLETAHLLSLAKELLEADRVTLLLGESLFTGPNDQQNVNYAAEIAQQLQKDEEPIPLNLLLPWMNSRGAADMGCYPHRELGFEPVEQAGKNTTEILEGCLDGSIQALFLLQTDLINEYPDRQKAIDALKKVPTLIVADLFHHQTAEQAHLFFPLSAYTEEDGTFTNLAGRVQRSEKVLPQLDGTLSGYQFLLALGERWGAGWKQVRPQRILNMLAQAIPHYRDISWDRVGTQGKPAASILSKPFKKNIEKELSIPSTKSLNPQEYSFRLVRGRYLFDTQGHKKYAPPLVERSEPCRVEIHPDDAKKFLIKDQQPLTLEGNLGRVTLPARLTTATHTGCLTILGQYDGITLNAIASEETPWVNIQS